MRLYFGGAEVPGWRSLLAAEQVPAVSLSFIGLTRRVKHTENWRLADKFPEDQKIFLDSGAYSLNREGADFSDADAMGLWVKYLEFVTANLDRIDVFSEFDALQLGAGWRSEMCAKLALLAADKFMPIWHSADGTDELERLAEEHGRVGVLQADTDTDYTALLNGLAAKGTLLHGVAMTRMEPMQRIRWDSVGSTSWLSPTQYGDTFVWSGQKLHRYPKARKENARRRHRTLFADNGFDADKIAEDDTTEVLKLSIWSWTKFVENIEEHGVTHSPESAADDFEERPPSVVGTTGGEVRNTELGFGPREKVLLPILSVTDAPVKDGDEEGSTEPRLGVVNSNLMQCSTCYLKDKCPQYKPGWDCAFEIPMVLTTTTQVRALRKTILAMQGQRVSMMRMMEQLTGGYADPNLSVEIGRLWKMISDDTEADKDRESFEVKITGDGQSGMISRIFGSGTADKMNALPAPQPASHVLEQFGIVDAEVIEEEPARREPE